jgi:hypothetical protein
MSSTASECQTEGPICQTGAICAHLQIFNFTNNKKVKAQASCRFYLRDAYAPLVHCGMTSRYSTIMLQTQFLVSRNVGTECHRYSTYDRRAFSLFVGRSLAIHSTPAEWFGPQTVPDVCILHAPNYSISARRQCELRARKVEHSWLFVFSFLLFLLVFRRFKN